MNPQRRTSRTPSHLGAFIALIFALTLLFIFYRGGNTFGKLEPKEPVNGDPVIEDEDPGLTSGDLQDLSVNELGDVMVIMYHDVNENEGDWVRSRENFRNDLKRFDELGYTLIPFNDYLNGNIDVPAGRSPLVFTFDDGTPGQLRFIEKDGQRHLDPDCAVGILLEYSKSHPDFGHAATFFIYSYSPFGDYEHLRENIEFLKYNGMEIGNHTFGHTNLSNLAPSEVAKEIGSLKNLLKDTAGYEVTSLALPYGGYPKSKENLMDGSYDGENYVNLGVLLVGAEPAPSPFSKNFKPSAIPRIQGSQEELNKWIQEMENYPARRFVSDGDKDTVTFREEKLELLEESVEGRKEIRTY